MVAKKRPKTQRNYPPDVLTVLEFADGVRLETTEAVACVLAQHNKGARIFRYQLVSEVELPSGRLEQK